MTFITQENVFNFENTNGLTLAGDYKVSSHMRKCVFRLNANSKDPDQLAETYSLIRAQLFEASLA